MKLLGISGSMRRGSHTRKMVEFILEEAHKFGAETRLLDLREVVLPLLNPEKDDAPNPAYDRAREMVEWADAFILGSPDYHGSMSGAMKNFVDYFWQEFMGKLFGFVVSSHEKGLTVHMQMRTVVRQCYGWSLPYGISFNGDHDFDKDGHLRTESLHERARMMARDVTVYGELLRRQFLADLAAEPHQPGFAQKYKV